MTQGVKKGSVPFFDRSAGLLELKSDLRILFGRFAGARQDFERLEEGVYVRAGLPRVTALRSSE